MDGKRIQCRASPNRLTSNAGYSFLWRSIAKALEGREARTDAREGNYIGGELPAPVLRSCKDDFVVTCLLDVRLVGRLSHETLAGFGLT